MSPKMAVVGTGYWGRNHVRTLSALAGEGVISGLVVCDVDSERAKMMAEEFNCEWCTDASKLSEMGVVATTIATPTPQHAPLAIQLMEAGIHVLVEKPLAMNEEEAIEILNCAKETGKILMVGHLFRYHAAIRKAAELVKGGVLGGVLHIESERLSVREPRPDIGVIAALAIHDMDIMKDLMGDVEAEDIHCIALPSDTPGIEDHAVIEMHFPGDSGYNDHGVTALVSVSWRSRVQGKVRSLRIIGRDASLAIDYLDHSGFWIHHHPNNAHGQEWGGFDAAPRERVELPLGEPSLTAELRAFINHVSGKNTETPLASGLVGLNGVKMVDLAISAARK
ncbi:MAG: Gfo/Idh/MocA family oxidoreductase [Candidatus Poseidoniaceae archaeon]|nr:Gfo/Idh/MocA family oxidoreductase [Candidatus Poseidoniaceae archaeon]